MKAKLKVSDEGSEVADLKNQLARALADYDNLRKRFEVERETWIKFSTERVILRILPVLDIFESAQKHLKDSGLAIGINEFKKILYDEDIEEINPVAGDNFDANIHEAVESINPPGGEGKKGTISELILTGWRYKEGKVIRFAKVKVYGERK